MRMATLGVVALTLAVGGCTFGLGEQVTFATRNLSLSGQLADGTFATDEGTLEIVQTGADIEDGVRIFFDGADGTQGVSAVLDFDGNLGALCPGARVELEGEGGQLEAVDARGAPPEMLGELSFLALRMETNVRSEAGDELLQPRLVTISATEGSDGFSRMQVTSTTTVDGEERTLSANFEVAREIEPAEVPGWEGDTWNGQPIANWE